MKKYLTVLSITIAALIMPTTSARAFFIVDTGAGSQVGTWVLTSTNQRAAKFNVGGNYSINSIEYWIANGGTNTTAQIKLVDNILKPTPTELFNGTFLVDNNKSSFGWKGLYGLNINVSGNYWLLIDNFDGGITNETNLFLQSGTPNPLKQTAFRSDKINGSWILETFPEDYGLRIVAEKLPESEPVVPEPTTIALFATGLSALIFKRRIN